MSPWDAVKVFAKEGWDLLCSLWFHREQSREDKTDSWYFKQSLINPETQALCKRCSDVFTPEQLTQQYFNVRGQETIKQRRVSFVLQMWQRDEKKQEWQSIRRRWFS